MRALTISGLVKVGEGLIDVGNGILAAVKEQDVEEGKQVVQVIRTLFDATVVSTTSKEPKPQVNQPQKIKLRERLDAYNKGDLPTITENDVKNLIRYRHQVSSRNDWNQKHFDEAMAWIDDCEKAGQIIVPEKWRVHGKKKKGF